MKDWWFDAEYQIERFPQDWKTSASWAKHSRSSGPTWADPFASCYGCPLIFRQVTTWAEPILTDYAQPPTLDWQSEHLAKLNELTLLALEQAPGRYLVGYTDLHPGIDWLAALRGTESLLYDFYDNPDDVQAMLAAGTPDFVALFTITSTDCSRRTGSLPSRRWKFLHLGACISPRATLQQCSGRATSATLSVHSWPPNVWQ